MSNIIQPAYFNRVRYFLRSSGFTTVQISEPIGYQEDEKTFKRSLKVHGVFINLSNNLKFYKGDENNNGGFDFISRVYDVNGINAEVALIKEEKNPQTGFFEESYRGVLDFSTMIIESNQISIKFNESGLYTALKARQSEKLELDRLDTMDGDPISELSVEKVALDGRAILLKSLLESNINGQDAISTAFRMGFDTTETRTGSLGIPVSLTYKSDERIHPVVADQFTTTPSIGEATIMFYEKSDKVKTLDLEISVTTTIKEIEVEDLGTDVFIKVELAKYEDNSLAAGTAFDLVSFDTLYTVPDPEHPNNHVIDFTVSKSVTLMEGESLAVIWHGGATGWGTIFTDGDLKIDFVDTVASINIVENSFFDASQCNFVLPFEALERLIHITTGRENSLISNFLGRTDIGHIQDGEGSLTGITHGLWIRRFDALPVSDDNQFKALTTSYKDFTESYSAVWNTGYGIEKVGFKDVVRFEELKYFYQMEITINLPNQAKKIKRTVAKERFFSGLELGFKKPSGDRLYEEAMGLDEYNIKNTFTSIIVRLENVFSKISNYRSDSYGIEFARRKSIETNPTDDTRYDKEVFLLDLKRGATDVFSQRLFADDFAKEPTGIFSPETAHNLRFSPVNILLRWGWWIRVGLEKYKSSFIRASSSEGNSKLTTQLIGGNEYPENGSILVSELEKPRMLPEIIEFEHEATFEVLKQVQGKTLVNGQNIQNVYGLVCFINENGNKEYGFLLELKPNKEGKWKLISANKPITKIKHG